MSWREVTGWLLDIEGYALQEVCRDKDVLEIGAWMGRSTICIAEVAKSVVTVEHFEADDCIRQLYPQPRSPDALRDDLTANIERSGLSDKIIVVDSKWEDFLPQYIADGKSLNMFDVVFYDADHHWPPLKKFLKLLVGFSKTVCVHDYGKKEPEYKYANSLIEGFAKSTGRSLLTYGSLAVMHKP